MNTVKFIWTPEVSDVLTTEVETGNEHAAVVSDGFVTVAYVPRKNSRLCHSFLNREWYY